MRKIKIQSILAAIAGLLLATGCSSSFLDTDPTDAVSSEKVPVPENAEALVNGAWYNLFDYSSTYANIGYRALQCLDDMMASDVVSRPKYGFNSSYQFDDIAISSKRLFPLKGIRKNSGRLKGKRWSCVPFAICTWCNIISSRI